MEQAAEAKEAGLNPSAEAANYVHSANPESSQQPEYKREPASGGASQGPKTASSSSSVKTSELHPSLGVVERSDRNDRTVPTDHIDPGGATPLGMDMSEISTAISSRSDPRVGDNTAPLRTQQAPASFRRMGRTMSTRPAQQQQQQQGSSGTGESDCTILNRTNEKLQLLARSAEGQVVKREIAAKGSDGFYVPLGTMLTVFRGTGKKPVHRQKVTNLTTSITVAGSEDRAVMVRHLLVGFSSALVAILIAVGIYVLIRRKIST